VKFAGEAVIIFIVLAAFSARNDVVYLQRVFCKVERFLTNKTKSPLYFVEFCNELNAII